MKSSLIITTYNWKEALNLALQSLARQTQMPDEVLIADDGSTPDTAELVADWAKRLPIPVLHLWQEDIGFRVARSRNRAIAAARGDYILLLDGDMILHANYVEDHLRAARRGFFVQGARLLTGPHAAARLLRGETLDLGFFSPDIQRRRHTIRNKLLSALVFARIHANQKAIRSCNQGYWKDDLLRVNGFDEQMLGWGREDNEIAARLYHSGIKRRNLKFAGLTTHIHHQQRKPPGENPNDKYLRATIANKITRCTLGIDQHLSTTTR